MGDEDKLRMGMGIRRDSKGLWISVIIPKMEAAFVTPLTFYKGTPVLDHIFPFMPVEIHTICVPPISPPKLA